ncbi:MAG: hypothetical protein ACYCXP_13540 [Leptospirillum sp.]
MARFITETKEADYVFTVKKKQPTMFEDIESLPWEGFPPRQTFSTLDKGHGRIERRTLTVSSELKEVFPEFSFPGHQQVFRLELNTSNLDGSPPPARKRSMASPVFRPKKPLPNDCSPSFAVIGESNPNT